MHELGMCESIVDAVQRRAGDRPVRRVRVRVGALHAVEPDAFTQSFQMAAAGTVAEDAVPDLVLLPVTIRCRGCGGQGASPAPVPLCPACGGADVELTGGDELMLESIEYKNVVDPTTPG